MERPIRKLKTPLGKDVEMKDYLTTRERNAVRAVFIKHSTFSTDGTMPKVEHVSGEATEEAEGKLIETAVISYDGSSENVLGRLLDGDPQEYDFIVSEASSSIKGNFPTAKQPTAGSATSPQDKGD